MAKGLGKLRAVVVLTGYGEDGKIVHRLSVDYDKFYGDSGHLIDDRDEIERRGIRAITGEIYNSKGEIQSNFVNFYRSTGEYVCGRAVHSDGTVCEQ
jgi:hypothetical protein